MHKACTQEATNNSNYKVGELRVEEKSKDSKNSPTEQDELSPQALTQSNKVPNKKNLKIHFFTF